MGWKGAGGCVIASHALQRLRNRLARRADEFLTDRLHDNPLAGNDLAAFGNGLADLPQIGTVAARACLRPWNDDPAAGQIGRQRLAHCLAPREWCHRDTGSRGLGSGHLGGKLILGRCGNHVLELHLQLVEQLLVALGRLTPFILACLGDAQLEIFDDGPRNCDFSLRDGRKRCCLEQLGAGNDDIAALGNQQRLERIDVIGKGLAWRIHRG